MKVGDNAIAATLSRTSCVEPVLRTPPIFVEKWRKLCIICFSGVMKKNAKRANLQKIADINSYINREHYYGLSMNIVTVNCTKE